jgi:uncharacterized membrane protein YphA (DoxX/SURF4 family)
MKFLISLARIIVGNLFIFSGIVKANDPLGFSYKLEEYFIEFGMDWHWLEEILVPLAAALCIVEIILGIAVLVGYRMKSVSWVLLLMILFFTVLTGASAIFEIVRSCGCFGDAIPLTPWESFYKDLILLALILVLFAKRATIKPFVEPKFDVFYLVISSAIMLALSFMLEWFAPFIFTLIILGVGVIAKFIKASISAALATSLSLIGSVWFSAYAVEHLPFKDFRPYAEGKNIPDQMKLPEGAQPPVYENILVYKNKETGEVKEFTSEEYTNQKVWENESWEWQDTESTLIEEGDVAKITDFSVTSHDGTDYTDIILSEEEVLLIIAYDLSKSGTDHWKEITDLTKKAKAKGVKVLGLSAAGAEQKNEYIKKHDLNFDFYITDGIVLKTIVRSNPGLVMLKKGTVTGKWHENDVPSVDQL